MFMKRLQVRVQVPQQMILIHQCQLISHLTPNESKSTALLAGGCAGTSVDVALFPLDTIKTRLQVGPGVQAQASFVCARAHALGARAPCWCQT